MHRPPPPHLLVLVLLVLAPTLAFSHEHGYIVTLTAYRPYDDQLQVLGNILSPRCSWHDVPRENPAGEYPTDFVVVHVSLDVCLTRLRAATEHVRFVTPERMLTRDLKGFSDESDVSGDEDFASFEAPQRFRMNSVPNSSPVPGARVPLVSVRARASPMHSSITHVLGAPTLWDVGFTGQNVRVGVFDTGLRADHPHFRYIKDRTNWTNEPTRDDGVGHGTFVAGVIASSKQCFGFAPDAHLHIFRVFTNKQESFTSWFLDAFNYAIYSKIHVLNLSIGGPDFRDRPFVEKVLEMSANNIIVVSAIGNDGPLYGTLNNPADQMDVIGVGGITWKDSMAPFSSRGMTTWELPDGYGRVKPDVVTYSKNIRGSRVHGGCRSLSGTSVASPVVAGVVTLLSSIVPVQQEGPHAPPRERTINPASMKQALIAGADRIQRANVFEQGNGKLNLDDAFHFLSSYSPHASAVPSKLDLTDCPYMWPYCKQPLYHGGMPVIVNITVLNGMSVTGTIEDEPVWEPEVPHSRTDVLEMEFTYSPLLWPWSGYMAVHISVRDDDVREPLTVGGRIQFVVVSDRGERSHVYIELKTEVIPTPAREKRLLWDQFHNLRYPGGYFPRDNLDVKSDVLDWNGDHIHTNFREVFTFLRKRGYFIEVLGRDWTCFDAKQYGALLLVDPEEEYFAEEIDKLRTDVLLRGLGLVVIGEWYNTDTMEKIKFFDDNTDRMWYPVTGGANVPALNDVLSPLGIEFSDRIFKGAVQLGKHKCMYATGTSIARFPAKGHLVRAKLREVLSSGLGANTEQVPILGLLDTNAALPSSKIGRWKRSAALQSSNKGGRVVVYGDSNAWDMNHRRGPAANWFLQAMVDYVTQGKLDETIFAVATDASGASKNWQLDEPFVDELLQSPPRRKQHNDDMLLYSKVLGAQYHPQCLVAADAAEQGGEEASISDEHSAEAAEPAEPLPSEPEQPISAEEEPIRMRSDYGIDAGAPPDVIHIPAREQHAETRVKLGPMAVLGLFAVMCSGVVAAYRFSTRKRRSKRRGSDSEASHMREP